MAKMPDVPDSLLEKPLTLPEEDGAHKSRRPSGHKSIIKKLLVTTLVLVILAGGTFGGWKYIQSRDTKKSPVVVVPKSVDTTESGQDVPTAATKVFTSDELALQLNVPTNWTAATKDDGIVITSPVFSFTTTDKGTVKGTFKVYMRLGARDVDGKYIGQGVAIAPSQTLTYSQPGTDQRKTTGLTEFGSATSDHFTFFMITGDFQLKKDDTLGPSYGKEASTYIIVGGYSAPSQVDDLGFSNVPLNQYQAKHVYTQALDIVKSLKLQ